jgi:RNA polymerase sigma factor (sigma-70 family)
MNDEERRRFREVASDCTPTMIRLAYLITGSQPAAERALRQALSKTARRWTTAQAAPEHYIVSTLCRTQAGWRHRWTRTARDGGPFGAAANHDLDGDTALRDRSDLHSAMRQAVRSLSRPERVVIALQQYEELNVAETAEVLGWSEKQVRHRTGQARARLRDLLAELSAPDGDDPDPRSPEPVDTGRHASTEAPA